MFSGLLVGSLCRGIEGDWLILNFRAFDWSGRDSGGNSNFGALWRCFLFAFEIMIVIVYFGVLGNGDIQWCFSQVKGTLEDDVTEGEIFIGGCHLANG